jgi:uncharacterized protein
MRWTPGRQSPDVEDRRDESPGRRAGGLRVGLGGLVVVFLLSVLFRQNFFQLLNMVPADTSVTTPGTSTGSAERSPEEERLAQFVSFVLDDTQDTWTKLLPAAGVQYERARLVLFRDAIESACGFAESASGPFYCPEDGKVYIDLGFYEDLKRRFGAGGDFAQAYVIAHEIGHHVQRLIGIEQRVREMQARDPRQANALSVRMELQADCFAGVWGHSTEQRNILEQGDIEEGLNAAAAIGDDRIQRMTRGRVSPESFTHGSSADRVQWFKRGFDSGDLKACDTFSNVRN